MKNDLTAGYRTLAEEARGLLAGQSYRIANAANLSALIFHRLEQVNWAGFYFLEDDRLIVGPFQGQPACVEIGIGRGVCGVAAATRTTQRVADVHAFEGHIACDVASRSELVVPLVLGDELIGVLDIDSPVLDRFSADDQAGIEALGRIFLDSIA